MLSARTIIILSIIKLNLLAACRGCFEFKCRLNLWVISYSYIGLTFEFRKSFEPFGTLRTGILSAHNTANGEDFLDIDKSIDSKPGYECPKVKDLVLVYVAFDILFVNDESVINRSLKVFCLKG